MEYVEMALTSLNQLVAGEPVTTTIQSILRIQEAVERFISGSAEVDSDDTASPGHNLLSVQFPSINRNNAGSASDLIYFTDRNHDFGSNYQSNTGLQFGSDSAADPLWGSNFDVTTTDLFNFFST